MQHLTVLGLLLACAVSFSSCGVALENGEPILWANSVSQLTDFPNQNGVVVPNPWNYLQRMGFYRLLIAATDPFMGSMGTNATDSPLWGLPLQLAWMITSGKLHCTNCTKMTWQKWMDGMLLGKNKTFWWLKFYERKFWSERNCDMCNVTHSVERFADPTGATTCGLKTEDPLCISTQSWWSCKYN